MIYNCFFEVLIKPRLKSVRVSQTLNFLIRHFSVNMPRSVEYVNNIKFARDRARDKFKSTLGYDGGSIHLQFIGSGAKGAPRSLFLCTEGAKYMFNCGEGTQRLANEHKLRIARVENVFITCPIWENIGGLPGLCLTMRDAGAPHLTIHGPMGTEQIFEVVKKFVNLSSFVIKMANCATDCSYEDNIISVFYIPLIRLSTNEQGSHPEPSPPNTGTSSVNLDNTTELTDAIQSSNSSPNLHEQLMISIAYVCKFKPKPGALDLNACVERSVPPGPLLGKLKAGIDVKLQDGTVVKSSDVKFPDSPGQVFIVVECPSVDFLDSLLNEKEFENYQAGALEENIAATVIHFTSAAVMKHEKYQEWMNRFSTKTQHVNCNDSNKCTGSLSVHVHQIQLNILEPNIFPLLKDDSIADISIDSNIVDEDLEDNGYRFVDRFTEADDSSDNVKQYPTEYSSDDLVVGRPHKYVVEKPPYHVGYTLRQITYRPEQADVVLPLGIHREKIISIIMNMEGFSEELRKLKTNLNAVEKHNANELYGPYPKILFLGTGSAVPSKVRNTSGILINLSCSEHVLLDCGEGTYTQIFRFYGSEESDKILTELKAIFISHTHPDHHLGLIGLLKARAQAFSNLRMVPYKVFLFSPRHILQYLGNYSQSFEPLFDTFVFVPNSSFDYVNPDIKIINDLDIFKTLKMKNILTTPVKHCPFAYGISFIHSDGWKLTYSGDSMPCESLVDIGKLSDVLIHEATMEDNLKKEACLKMHSTVSEAINMGKLMNARFTLLTHFSQRYCKVPRLDEDFPRNTGIAFDNMIVSLNDLKKLHLLIPALRIMFAEYEEQNKLKAAKKRMREEQDELYVKAVERSVSHDRL